jgi:hypothetical protein
VKKKLPFIFMVAFTVALCVIGVIGYTKSNATLGIIASILEFIWWVALLCFWYAGNKEGKRDDPLSTGEAPFAERPPQPDNSPPADK